MSYQAVIYNCRRQFFNVRANRGLDCITDSDCPNGTICSLFGDGCVVTFDDQLNNYLEVNSFNL